MNDFKFQIEQAAASSLRTLRRNSFSNEGFSEREISAIANAIAAAIEVYDQCKLQNN